MKQLLLFTMLLLSISLASASIDFSDNTGQIDLNSLYVGVSTDSTQTITIYLTSSDGVVLNQAEMEDSNYFSYYFDELTPDNYIIYAIASPSLEQTDNKIVTITDDNGIYYSSLSQETGTIKVNQFTIDCFSNVFGDISIYLNDEVQVTKYSSKDINYVVEGLEDGKYTYYCDIVYLSSDSKADKRTVTIDTTTKSNGGSGGGHKHYIKQTPVITENVTVVNVTRYIVEPLNWSEFTKKVNKTLPIVEENDTIIEIKEVEYDPCTDDSLTNQQKIQLHGCRLFEDPSIPVSRYPWIILIILILLGITAFVSWYFNK